MAKKLRVCDVLAGVRQVHPTEKVCNLHPLIINYLIIVISLEAVLNLHSYVKSVLPSNPSFLDSADSSPVASAAVTPEAVAPAAAAVAPAAAAVAPAAAAAAPASIAPASFAPAFVAPQAIFNPFDRAFVAPASVAPASVAPASVAPQGIFNPFPHFINTTAPPASESLLSAPAPPFQFNSQLHDMRFMPHLSPWSSFHPLVAQYETAAAQYNTAAAPAQSPAFGGGAAPPPTPVPVPEAPSFQPTVADTAAALVPELPSTPEPKPGFFEDSRTSTYWHRLSAVEREKARQRSAENREKAHRLLQQTKQRQAKMEQQAKAQMN